MLASVGCKEHLLAINMLLRYMKIISQTECPKNTVYLKNKRSKI